MSRWLPALRIARRTAGRQRLRSLLVALLVAVPVAGATLIDVVARTIGAPERRAQRAIGPADLVAVDVSAERLAALLPPGARLAPLPLIYSVVVDRGDRNTRSALVDADAGEPLHRDLASDVVAGRAPRGDREVLVTPALARRLGLLDGAGDLRGGAEVTLHEGPSAPVAGIVRMRFCLNCERIIARRGSTLARAARRRAAGGLELSIPGLKLAFSTAEPRVALVDLPRGTAADAVAGSLRRQGVTAVPRGRIAHPPSGVSPPVDAARVRAWALAAIVVGLGLLEVVLLAGTAFAVGARRQTRELGLVAAGGGAPRDLRRIVLAQGLLLGALGAALGVVAGAVLAVAGTPLWERYDNAELLGWRFGPWEIAGAALVGLLSGLAAALVPAIGAGRMRPVDALAGRVGGRRGRRRRTTPIGAALLAAGAATALLGDRLLAGEFERYVRRLAEADRGGVVLDAPSSTWAVALVEGGGMLAVIGLVLVVPALIGALARLGARLPLSARLAVRDAERQRHRTGPATAAIAVAVAGSVLSAFLIAMQFRADEVRSPPMLPPDVLAIARDEPAAAPAQLLRAVDAAAAQLPGARRTVQRLVAARGGGQAGLRVHEHDCPSLLAEAGRCGTLAGNGHVAVVAAEGAAAATLAGGTLDRRARDALAGGRVVVFDRAVLDAEGRVHVATGPGAPASVAGHFVAREHPFASLPTALVSPALARARGWRTATEAVLLSYGRGVARDDVDSAMTAAADLGAAAFVDSGPGASRNAILLAVGLVAAIVTLLGVAIAVALSAAEGRADLATLAAVGAPPRRRRALLAAQALLIGGLGAALGVALGSFVAFTARATTGSPDFVVPWANLGAALLGAPLLAALVAALCARGRLPLVRRAE